MMQLRAEQKGVELIFVCTQRNVEDIVRSELQHWTLNNLEKKHSLSGRESAELGSVLRYRAQKHRDSISKIIQHRIHINILPLEKIHMWPMLLAKLKCRAKYNQWEDAFSKTVKMNSNPSIPLQGVLLTFRLETGISCKIQNLSIFTATRLYLQIHGSYRT